MIRRDELSAGQVGHWLLIPQIEHARLSGLLAEHWNTAPSAPLEPRQELVEAIYHHDDGWADWDRRPDADPQSGRPLEFTEMPLAESLGIWQQSIFVAAARGDLQAYVVSGHFSALLRSGAARWQSSKYGSSLALAFLDEQDGRREAWLRSWIEGDARQRNAAIAGRALAWLQFFDALSLWFCCAERNEPRTFNPPDGRRLTATPAREGSGQFTLAPWPLNLQEVEWSVSARRIAAGHYADRAALVVGEPSEYRLRLSARE